jgi:hypothetical protein
MNFVEALPKVGGKSVILTVVDRFSKMAHFIPLSHSYSATSVAKAFFDGTVRLHGLPCSIVSDRDPFFTSRFWAELFQLTRVKLLLSSAFHPQTDGQSEVTNRIIALYLRCLTGDRPRSWLHWLPWAEFCYNTSFQSALKTTPFNVVYGRDPPPLLKYQAGMPSVAAVDAQLKDRDEFLGEIRQRLLLSQDLMKDHHNKKRRAKSFDINEWVWLRLQHRPAAGIAPLKFSKLSPRYFEPYKIIEKIGELAYRLQLPEKARIHNVFHVALLKKFQGTPPVSMVPLPPLQHGRILATPAKVMKARLNRGTWEVLVSWLDRPPTESTWEKLDVFKKTYPDIQLEDKPFLGEEGNVIDAFIGKKYQRRKNKS